MLTPIGLRPLARRRLSGLRLALALLPVLLALGIVAWALEPALIGASSQQALSGSPRAASAAQAVDFSVCFQNPAWTAPPADVQGQHLQANVRYKGLDLAQLKPERVHIETGPFRSNSAFSDFIELSGLWNDPSWRGMACGNDLRGKVEVWLLGAQVQQAQLRGVDLTLAAHSQPRGVEALQLTLPPTAEALHVVDETGAKLAPDVNLRS